MKKIVILILVTLLLAGCSQKVKPAEQPVPAPTEPAVVQPTETVTPTPTEAQKETNTFDARKVKAGDQVAGLKISKVEVHNASDEDYDAVVSFDGEVTVSGTFKHNKDDEFLDHEISFVVDEGSVDQLPKLAHDQRYVWFMFMNHDEAEKSFGVPGTEGKATVTIKNYCINYAHTEVWNTAELVKAEIK
ncbi:MAG: lipoprotein [Pseudomonadota bacterium]